MKIPTVSPTRLKTGKVCEFKYFLTYVWGWSEELFLYTFASEFGTAVHATLQAYAEKKGKLDYKKEYQKQLKETNPFIEDMKAAPSKARASFFVEKKCETCPHFNAKKAHCKLMNQHIEHFEGCPRKLYDDGLVMIETALDRYKEYFLTGIKSEDNPEGKILGIEAPAGISWGRGSDGEDIVMNGFIDLVVEYDSDTVLIIDYKTGYSTPTHDEFIKDLQPRMYSYAARRMYPDYKFYWVQFDYFRSIPLEYAFTSDDDELTRQEVVSLYNSIKSAKVIKRRAYDRHCKYLCNRPFCDEKWEQLKRGEDGSNPDYNIGEVKDDETG